MRVTKPRDGEPIRAVTTATGTRFRVVVDTGTTLGGKRRQLTRTLASLREARALVATTRSAVAAGTFQASSSETVDAVLTSWLEVRRHEVRAVTLRGYTDSAKPWRRAFGGKRVQALTRDDVQRAIAVMHDAGRTGRTIAAALVVLRAAMALAVRDGLVPRNVAADVRAPRHVAPERSAWGPGEARAFLTSVDGHRYEALFRLSLLGLRRGEVLALSWAAVDLDAPLLAVVASRVSVTPTVTATDAPKTARSRRTLPLSGVPVVVESLRALRRRQREEALALGRPWHLTDLLALDEVGQPLRPERYSDLWREACKDAGLPPLTLHEARHTAASLLAEAQVPPEVAAQWLGHDPAIYLRTYVHARSERVAAAGIALGAAFA